MTYSGREWEGEPTAPERGGIVHASYVSRDGEVRTHCGVQVDFETGFYTAPATQMVTCLECIVSNKEE